MAESLPTAQAPEHAPTRLARLEIRNFKAIEQLTLHLPVPSTPDVPDVFVLGSKNGVGKTSILEACALGMLSGYHPHVFTGHGVVKKWHDQPWNQLIRGDATASTLKALVTTSTLREAECHVTMKRDGMTFVEPGHLSHLDEREDRPVHPSWLSSVFGKNSEPLIAPPVLLFHSHRKIREGSSLLGTIVSEHTDLTNDLRLGDRITRPLSTFKLTIIRALMARSGLFEASPLSDDSDQIVETFNTLMREFAQGELDKLRPTEDNALELRVRSLDGSPSHDFDTLSSGQKEIIATFFLIWHATRDRPGLVLIDEPELHLNAEWQRLFVPMLTKLAPLNQYILATHSEEVFDSVPKARRLMLTRS